MKLVDELARYKLWYTKVAVGSLLFGGAIEGFMIATGFYDKVTLIEAQRRAEIQANKGQELTMDEFKRIVNEKFSW